MGRLWPLFPFVAVLLLSCTAPDLENQKFACKTDQDCLLRHCVSGVCQKIGDKKEGESDSTFVVDNADPGFKLLRDPNQWNSCQLDECGGLSYEYDFLYAFVDADFPEVGAQFSHTVDTEGTYRIGLWWPQGDCRRSEQEFFVKRKQTLLEQYAVDLSAGGDSWYMLPDRFAYKKGEQLVVELRGVWQGEPDAGMEDAADHGGWCYVADAVQIQLVD